MCLAKAIAAAALCICIAAVPRLTPAQDAPVTDLIRVEGNAIKLPLQSVMFLALKNNLQIAFQSLAPDISETEIMREESFYDPDFSLQYGKSRSVTQVGNFADRCRCGQRLSAGLGSQDGCDEAVCDRHVCRAQVERH